jgi:MFS family permease
MAIRQFFSGFGALLSGATAGYIIAIFDEPFSFGILFIISSILMLFGFLAFGTIDEPIKQNITKKEKSFKLFLQNAKILLKNDNKLQIQVITFLLAYSYLFSLPFIIVDASSKINLDGTAIASIITVQMIGSMFSNILWGKLSSNNKNKLISNITIILHIVSISLAFIASNIYVYMFIFFLSGAAMDGYRLCSTNLLINIAPEDKRPVYSAIQSNITSFGIFFSILGGFILHFSSYSILYSFTIFMLFLAFVFSLKLSEE